MAAADDKQPFAKLTPEVREMAIKRHLVGIVHERTGFTKSYVSQTFHGRVVNPNPGLVAEIWKSLHELVPEAANEETK